MEWHAVCATVGPTQSRAERMRCSGSTTDRIESAHVRERQQLVEYLGDPLTVQSTAHNSSSKGALKVRTHCGQRPTAAVALQQCC